MADAFVQKLNSSNFNPEHCINELTLVNSDGASDLRVARQKVQTLSDETSGKLKRNVFKHYMQFIETAKEISYLESEMYQLSHMLTEQKSLMTSLLETSLSGSKVTPAAKDAADFGKKRDKVEPVRRIQQWYDKVHDCPPEVMESISCQKLILDGKLMELDSNSFHLMGAVYVYLLSESVLLATLIRDSSKSPYKHKFEVLYDLDSLAIVNVRDMIDVKNTFKFMKFPDTRLFACDNPSAKKEWLEHFDLAKKANKSRESSPPSSTMQVKERPLTRVEDLEPERKSPVSDDDSYGREDENHNLAAEEKEAPDWLMELPEDLDVCIAQRDFEEATNLIEKAEQHFDSNARNTYVKEMRVKVDQRIKHLTQVLQSELKVSPGKSLQGGPRASRRAVALLIRLGKASKACDLFLKHHNAILKHSVKQLKIEGVTTLYIKRLCAVFFSTIIETGKGLELSFPDQLSCTVPYVIWVRDQLKSFVANFSRQVFTPQVTLPVVVECVLLARQHCNQLVDFGLDMVFLMNSLLCNDVERIILETKEKLCEAVKLRATEKWKPTNLQNKAGLDKFIEEMKEYGIGDIQNYVYDECLVALTSNTVHFSKAYLTFVDDVLKLHTDESHTLIVECIVEILAVLLKHTEISMASEKSHKEANFIRRNGAFLLAIVLNAVEKRYREKLQQNCDALRELRHFAPQFGVDVKTHSAGTAFV